MDVAVQIVLCFSAAIFLIATIYTCFFFGACSNCGCRHANGPQELLMVSVPLEHTVLRPGSSLNWVSKPKTRNKSQQVSENQLKFSEYQPDISKVLTEFCGQSKVEDNNSKRRISFTV